MSGDETPDLYYHACLVESYPYSHCGWFSIDWHSSTAVKVSGVDFVKYLCKVGFMLE
jgi:hypothetical protein